MGFVSAVGFSPSSLVYELGVGEEDCKIITLNSDSETIVISDKWIADDSIEWKINNCDKEADFHGLAISYNDELKVDEREVEVCLSGNNIGEYKGVVLLREEQQGNSIMQIAVWIRAVISGSAPVSDLPVDNGGSSSGGGETTLPPKNTTNTTTNTPTESQPPKTLETNTQETSNIIETENNKLSITGAVIGATKNNYKIIIIVAVVLMVGVGLIYSKRKKNIKGSDYIHNNINEDNNNNNNNNNNEFNNINY